MIWSECSVSDVDGFSRLLPCFAIRLDRDRPLLEGDGELGGIDHANEDGVRHVDDCADDNRLWRCERTRSRVARRYHSFDALYASAACLHELTERKLQKLQEANGNMDGIREGGKKNEDKDECGLIDARAVIFLVTRSTREDQDGGDGTANASDASHDIHKVDEVEGVPKAIEHEGYRPEAHRVLRSAERGQ